LRQPSLLQRTYDRHKLTWMPDANVDAQTAHLFVSCTIVFFFPACVAQSPLWGMPVVFAWIVVKEWGFDLWEEKDTWQGSALDSLFYVIGAAVSLGTWYATMGLR
jgi:hypothetical protein